MRELVWEAPIEARERTHGVVIELVSEGQLVANQPASAGAGEEAQEEAQEAKEEAAELAKERAEEAL